VPAAAATRGRTEVDRAIEAAFGMEKKHMVRVARAQRLGAGTNLRACARVW